MNITLITLMEISSRWNSLTAVKDLGVFFDPKPKFSLHFDYIIKKVNQSLSFVLRNTLRLHDINTVIILYNGVVRSKLEYCSSIWFPTTKKDSQRIEHNQDSFVRFLFSVMMGFILPFRIKSHTVIFSISSTWILFLIGEIKLTWLSF